MGASSPRASQGGRQTEPSGATVVTGFAVNPERPDRSLRLPFFRGLHAGFVIFMSSWSRWQLDQGARYHASSFLVRVYYPIREQIHRNHRPLRNPIVEFGLVMRCGLEIVQQFHPNSLFASTIPLAKTFDPLERIELLC
jgi:hypothetical protein